MTLGWIPDVVDGSPILPAWGNQIRDRTVTPFTNAASRNAAIPSPKTGMLTFLDDVDVVEKWTGSAWIPITPLGVLGRAILTASGFAATGTTDIVGLAVTVTVGTARLIRVEGFSKFTAGTGSATNVNFSIREGSTTLADNATSSLLSAPNVLGTLGVAALLTPTPGAHTYKLSVTFNANGDNVVTASPTSPAYILVTDLGAA